MSKADSHKIMFGPQADTATVRDDHAALTREMGRSGAFFGTRPDARVTAVRIERKPINRQGYDAGGTYFGVGEPVFAVEWDLDGLMAARMSYVRAESRKQLRDALKTAFPEAKVSR